MGNHFSGFRVNSLDLSPNYAGSLMALVNGAGALTGVIAPVFVGVMTANVSFISTFLLPAKNYEHLIIFTVSP